MIFYYKMSGSLFSGIFKISLGTEKEDKIKNVITGCQITGLLTIIVFMIIYMLYTRSLFIAPRNYYWSIMVDFNFN